MASNSTLNLNGRVEKTDIPTLLKTVESDKLSGELTFNRSGEKISLFFLFGQLYHATWGSVTGIDAVSELLGWKSGTYSFNEGIIPAQASINDDIDRILSTSPAAKNPVTRQAALKPTPSVTPIVNPPVADSLDYIDSLSLAPFDLASLNNTDQPGARPANLSQYEPPTGNNKSRSQAPSFDYDAYQQPSAYEERHAPHPPSGGLYCTRFFCLPAGEQMATSLVATGPQLEEELLHLADVGFTGYVLGGSEIEGLPAVGICLLKGRFIHAFLHYSSPQGLVLLEGERAYRGIMDQKGQRSARFYWFYEITQEAMRAAIALLTPPTRYAHLEVRIVRFKELLRMLSEESHTGCLKLTIPPPARAAATGSPGETAFIPIFKGSILGLWTRAHARLTNDGQLLQRFLNEPQAFLDLHTTATVSDPGIALETLVNLQGLEMPADSGGLVLPSAIPAPSSTLNMPLQPVMTPAPIPQSAEAISAVDDDERQLRLITTISRMESTWTQAQRKERVETQSALLMLAGFANDVLSLNEGVSGRRSVVDMINRALRQELVPFRMFFQTLDLVSGRVNLVKLLKEYDMFAHDSEQAGNEYYRESSKALRTLIRSSFQNYVSMVRSEAVRFESQEMYEIFLQEVVKRI